mmetsp:Transcript_128882/g.412747  ORF Transcript_128882/g.412747 Transcript_128882/m.412747 type:complete len:204 (-) Transcript_128882:647-1258(-)
MHAGGLCLVASRVFHAGLIGVSAEHHATRICVCDIWGSTSCQIAVRVGRYTCWSLVVTQRNSANGSDDVCVRIGTCGGVAFPPRTHKLRCFAGFAWGNTHWFVCVSPRLHYDRLNDVPEIMSAAWCQALNFWLCPPRFSSCVVGARIAWSVSRSKGSRSHWVFRGYFRRHIVGCLRVAQTLDEDGCFSGGVCRISFGSCSFSP